MAVHFGVQGLEIVLDQIETLHHHESVHGLRDRASAGCWKWVADVIDNGELTGLNSDDIELRFTRCALIFSPGLVSYPFFETTLTIHSRKHPCVHTHGGLTQLGHYRLITDIDGTAVDDYFVIEKMRCGSVTD